MTIWTILVIVWIGSGFIAFHIIGLEAGFVNSKEMVILLLVFLIGGLASLSMVVIGLLVTVIIPKVRRYFKKKVKSIPDFPVPDMYKRRKNDG